MAKLEAAKREASTLERGKLWAALFTNCLDEVGAMQLEPGDDPVALAIASANEAYAMCESELEPEQASFSNLAELSAAAAQAEAELLGTGAAQAQADAAQQDVFYRFLKRG
jgi:hypothetical protein